MRILFIRHSQTILDKEHSGLVWQLSSAGIDAAHALASNLLVQQCKAIYPSFQTKAIETALLLAKANYIPIKPLDNLTETTSVTNCYFENFAEQMQLWHQGNYRINDGETKQESLIRFNNAVASIVAKEHNNDMVGIVAHGNVLAIFSEQYSDLDSFAIHHKIQMPDLALFDWESKKFELNWGER